MKKEKSTVTVLISIFLLLLLIVLPPLFRALFPNNVKKSTNVNKEISVLRCSNSDDYISVLATVKYIDGNIESNIIKYTIENEEAFASANSKLKNEYDMFNGIKNINKSVVDKVTIFTLDKEVREEEKNIANYFIQSVSGEKNFYENIGYSCNIIKG